MVRMGSDAYEHYPKLSIDAAGAGLIGWAQDDDAGQDSVWGVSFTGATLSTPQVLDNYITDTADDVDVAIAATGAGAWRSGLSATGPVPATCSPRLGGRPGWKAPSGC
jgi:hypothetical protein